MGRKKFFVSDVHIGAFLFSRELEVSFLAFLDMVERESGVLFLVGDILDIWVMNLEDILRRHPKIIKRLILMPAAGVEIVYVEGNHDNNISAIGTFTNFKIVEAVKLDNHILVTHGHTFDPVVNRYGKMTQALNQVQRTFRNITHIDLAPVTEPLFISAMSSRVNKKVFGGIDVNRFIVSAVDAANKVNCDTVICGHIHQPEILDARGVHYINIGSFLDQESYLLQDEDGSFKLTYWGR